jgi:ComEC/Rec2-related protein
LPRYHWLFVLVPLLFVYTLITGMRPSAMRASLMAILFFCAPCFHRQFNTLTALAAAALIVHFFRPAFITDIGSILSFSVMLGLIALYKPFNAIFLRMMRAREIHAEAVLLKAADDFNRARALLIVTRLMQFVAGLCAVTIAAWLASMPLSAYFFGRVTPGGILANLIISPCAFMLVVAGVIGYAVSFVSLTLAAVFNNAAAVFTTIMIKTAALVSSMPFSNFKVDKFSSWVVWFWFALLLISAWCLRKWIEKCDDGLDWMGER